MWRWEFQRRHPEYRKRWISIWRRTDPKLRFARDGVWLITDPVYQMLAGPQSVLDDNLLGSLDAFNGRGDGLVVHEGEKR
jgi:hypothetical protein